MAERCDNSRSLPKKKRARHGFRYQMELNFNTEDAKQAFVARIDRAKHSLAAIRLACRHCCRRTVHESLHRV